MPQAESIRPARVDEARLLGDLALRSKAHWGYSPEFIERCRAELSCGEEDLLAEMGAKQLIVQSDPYAESFYAATGGVVTGKRESASIPGRYLPTLAIDLVERMH